MSASPNTHRAALIAALRATAPVSEQCAAADLRERVDATPATVLAAAQSALAAQPVEYTVTRFNCPFCRRYSRSNREPVVVHIARCWLNPATRACLTCAHFRSQSPEPEVGAQGVELCEAQQIELEGVRDHCPLWQQPGPDRGAVTR